MSSLVDECAYHREFEGREPDRRPTADEVRECLRLGNERYTRTHKPPRERPPVAGHTYMATVDFVPPTKSLDPGKWADQTPIAAVLGCADSRASPDHIFDQPHGRLFTIRTAGNTLDPKTKANIRYAIEKLEIPLVVVIGHEDCGAIRAALEGSRENTSDPYYAITEDIFQYIPVDRPAGDEELIAATVQANIKGVATSIRQAPDLVIRRAAPIVDAGLYEFASGTVAELK